MFQVRLPQDTAGKVVLRSLRLRGIFLLASKIRANQMTKDAINQWLTLLYFSNANEIIPSQILLQRVSFKKLAY